MSFPHLAHRISLATKVLLPWVAVFIASVALACLPARGDVILSGTGRTLVSGSGATGVYHPIAAQADLRLQGNLLTIVLQNLSPRDTTDAADALSSFYFDIVHNGVRPTITDITYQSADGPLIKVVKGGTDVQYHYMPPATVGGTATYSVGPGISDLRAFKKGDETWQLKGMNPAASPYLGFGIGTVGNSSAFPANRFDGPIVGNGTSAINFSIARGDVEPSGVGNKLQDAYLLQNTGTFTFQLSGTAWTWTENDIRREALFGFGTDAEGTITAAPEPSSLALGLLGTAALAWRQSRRRGSARTRAAWCRASP